MALEFSSATRRHFDSVALRYGLTCVASTKRGVRYEGSQVFLIVNFDNGRSYELGVEIGQINALQSERPFSLAEVLRLQCCPDAAAIDEITATDAGRLDEVLARLAALTSSYATEFLAGSDASFARLAILREEEGRAYAVDRRLGAARAQSEAAWARRDYEAVVAALEPLEAHLSPAEGARLAYSRKRMAS